MQTIQNSLNTATVVGSKAQSIGGGKHVIDHSYPEHKVTDGAFIVNPPAVGDMIREGDLGEFTYSTNEVKHLKLFVSNAVATSAATEFQVKAGADQPVPKIGDVLMIAPSDFKSGTGTARALTAVSLDSSGDFYTVTVATTLGTALTDGSVLVEAVEAGTTKAPLVVPNVVFPQDIYIYETPATTYNSASGFRYYTSLYDACAILGLKLTTAIPAGARVSLRSDYSDIKIVE